MVSEILLVLGLRTTMSDPSVYAAFGALSITGNPVPVNYTHFPAGKPCIGVGLGRGIRSSPSFRLCLAACSNVEFRVFSDASKEQVDLSATVLLHDL